MLRGILITIVLAVMLGLGILYFHSSKIITQTSPAKDTNANNTSHESEKENTTPIKNGKNMPANILATEDKNSKVYFVLDYLEPNPCFTPGGPLKPGCSNSDFFKNDAEERSEVPLSNNAKVFYCFVDYGDHIDHGTSGDDTVPDASYPLNKFIKEELNPLNLPRDYYFDIENNEIIAIYERCLP